MTPPVCSLEFWYYLANIVGVGILIKYAYDTNQIKKASLKQVDAANVQAEGIPCVVVIELPPDLLGQVRSYALKNVGNGVAFNVRARLSSWQNDEPFKALSPGDTADIRLGPDDFIWRSPLTCTFESLSGIVYQSESSYLKEGEEIVTNMRHTFRRQNKSSSSGG